MRRVIVAQRFAGSGGETAAAGARDQARIERLIGGRRVRPRWASSGVFGWMPAIAHSRLPSAGLTRCQTSSNGSAFAPICSRIEAVEADADDLPIGFAHDVEHFGVDALDVGLLRCAAALLQVEFEVGEHLRRRERAQVAQVGGVVGRLQPDEDHLRDALERGRIEVGGQA